MTDNEQGILFLVCKEEQVHLAFKQRLRQLGQGIHAQQFQ